MQICVIGTGYVGLVAGACLAELENNVICVDKDLKKLALLDKGVVPIYEPGLEDLIKTNVAKDRLKFAFDLDFAVKNSEICFIAVGTPQGEDGSADLQYVFQVAENIAKAMNEYKVIVTKSTVPVKTGEQICKFIKENTIHDFDIVSNPEFLRQGAAVEDFLHPDRIIIGTNSERAKKIMLQLYEPLTRNKVPIIAMDIKSAEMTKYASNAFLAIKISYANEVANLCEQIGANASRVLLGMCADSRIGTEFLCPGIGYGGSCFPKDVKAMMSFAKNSDCTYKLLKATEEINKEQRQIFVRKILNRFENDLNNKTFGVWGLAFKAQTNDMREAPSITIINSLLSEGAKIKAFDPEAIETAKEIFGNRIEYVENLYEVLQDANGLLLLTEWNEFKDPDFGKMKTLMKNPIIFDGRNLYDEEELIGLGFEYSCVGSGMKKLAKI
jgi:UDPglucose 6-dehydrogenase